MVLTSGAQILSALAMVAVAVLIGSLLKAVLGPQLLVVVAIVMFPKFLKGRWYRWIYIIYKTLPRDTIGIWRFIKMGICLYKWEKQKLILPKLFQLQAKKNPNKVALYSEDSTWTFQQMEDYSNKLANVFKSFGFRKGDTVALFMESIPEHVCTWLALSKIGVVTAMININHRKSMLVHSIYVVKAKGIVFSSSLAEGVEESRGNLECKQYFQVNTVPDFPLLTGAVDLNITVTSASKESPDEELNTVAPNDRLMYIYTSGTTGLPKAAILSYEKYTSIVAILHFMLSMREDDIIYDPLPLYHAAGAKLGMGHLIIFGNTVCIRKKFSASNFWKDCVKYKCTIAQYIGEICRYLLAVPPGDEAEKMHCVRLMYGNGLKSKVWVKFVQRFGIKEIGELYGASEGNSNLININSTIGSVGFAPRLFGGWFPKHIVKYDVVNNQPRRSKDGFCIKCKPGEVGLYIAKIFPKYDNDFLGYSNVQENSQRILSNVFTKEDSYYNSGDLMVMDELGYFYFKDRTGDSFRWRGENVATGEVEAIISDVLGLKDAIVYGVEVPNTEGRCGMAAILDPEDKIDLIVLAKDLRNNLPPYAIPLFLRILKQATLTNTYKLKKGDLQTAAYDIDKINDKLYFYDAKVSLYIPLHRELYERIISGQMRL